MADAQKAWRPRLWVRCLATAVPLLLASTLLYPQVLNPDWTDGTPADELPWLTVLVAAAAAVGYAALVSRIIVDQGTLRIVNPWGARTLPIADIVAVERGSFGVEFVTDDGRRYVGFAVQCTSAPPGRRPRWVDVATAVTGGSPLSQPRQPVQLAELAARVEGHGHLRGYQVKSLGPEEDGYLVFLVSIPGRDGDAKLALNGEVFRLSLPGGYTWPEFTGSTGEAREVLADQLTMLDAYADPRTHEVEVPRRMRGGTRKELRLSNGAVLRRHAWSRGPTPDHD